MLRTRNNTINLNEFNTDDVDLNDITLALAGINRFAGCSPRRLRVLRHSINVGNMAHTVFGRDAGIWGLFHDAHEYLMGDIPRPFFQLLDPEAQAAIQAWKYKFDCVIHAWLVQRSYITSDLDLLRAQVSHIDQKVLEDEMDFLWNGKYMREDFNESGMHVPQKDMVDDSGKEGQLIQDFMDTLRVFKGEDS